MPRINPEFDPNELQPPAQSTGETPPKPNPQPVKPMTPSQSTSPKSGSNNSSFTRREIFGFLGLVVVGGALGLAYVDAQEKKVPATKPVSPLPSPAAMSSPPANPAFPFAKPAAKSSPPAYAPTRLPVTPTRPILATAIPDSASKIPTLDRRPTPRTTETPKPISTAQPLPNRPSGITSIDNARSIMGDDLLGGEAIRHTFGINPTNLPPIPFDKVELERAKQSNLFLIYRIDKNADNSPLTVFTMEQLLKNKRSQLIRNIRREYGREHTDLGLSGVKDTPRPGWKFVSKDLLPNSQKVNFPYNSADVLAQTQDIANFLKNTLYKDQSMPEVLNKAFIQFENNKGDLGWGTIFNFHLNQLLRHRPVELVYDMAIYESTRAKKILADNYSITIKNSVFHPEGGFMAVGRFNGNGLVFNAEMTPHAITPQDYHAPYGVLFTI